MSEPSCQSVSENALFMQYVQVCTQALEAHQHEFPYKQLWEISRQVLDSAPDCVSAPMIAVDGELHTNLNHLEHVVNHPKEYIENPAKIDWQWLKNLLH